MPRVLTYRERSKEPSRRVVEPKVVRRVSARRPPTFMDEPVMAVTEQHEVVEVGPPAPSPVHEVVGFFGGQSPSNRRALPTRIAWRASSDRPSSSNSRNHRSMSMNG